MADKKKPTVFTKTMVEQTIKYFSDPNHDETNAEQMKALTDATAYPKNWRPIWD